MQINLSELNEARNPAERLITRDLAVSDGVVSSELARRVRKYLAVSIEQQTSWATDEAAAENWRQSLTDVGIFVFKEAFRAATYSGFCLFDTEFPIIYVNNSTSKTRQIFTLFHELAHLLFQTSGIDWLDSPPYMELLPASARRIEVVCNRFAADFLLPDDVFQRAIVGKRPTETTAENLANHFHVSRELVFRKFLDRNLIRDEQYKRAAKKWAEQRKPPGAGNYYNNQIAYLGSSYINLAFRRYYQNRINDVQLAAYLNIPPKNLSTFEERFARRGA